MFEDYEKLSCEQLLEKYRIKKLADFDNLMLDDKRISADLKVMFKTMDRLSFRANNVQYGNNRRPSTPIHLAEKKKNPLKSTIGDFMVGKLGELLSNRPDRKNNLFGIGGALKQGRSKKDEDIELFKKKGKGKKKNK